MAARKLDREPPLHEQVAWMALALIARESPHRVLVQLTRRGGDHRGTDINLISPGKRPCHVDMTEGGRKTWRKKFQQNKKSVRRGGRWNRILTALREEGVSLALHTCFREAWERLKTHEPVSLSPSDICPHYGGEMCDKRCPDRREGECPVLEELTFFGRYIAGALRDDWKTLLEVQ